MKTLLTTLALSLVLGIHSAPAGDRVLNGSGAAEHVIRYVYENLSQLIKITLSSSRGDLSDEERAVLEKIKSHLPEEFQNGQQLIFAKHPQENFFIDGAERIAKTGSAVGDPIYINRRMIYISDEHGERPISVGQAYAMLVHELGHHHGDYSHNMLDKMGVKARKAIESQSTSTFFSPNLAQALADRRRLTAVQHMPSFFSANYRPRDFMNPSSVFILNDHKRSVDLTSYITPAIVEHDVDLFVSGERQQFICGLREWPIRQDLISPTWERLRQGQQRGENYEYEASIVAFMDVICKHGKTDKKRFVSGYKVRFMFKLVQDGAKLFIKDHKQVKVQAFRDLSSALINTEASSL